MIKQKAVIARSTISTEDEVRRGDPVGSCMSSRDCFDGEKMPSRKDVYFFDYTFFYKHIALTGLV